MDSMSASIVRNETPEEKEYARYLNEIGIRKQIVSEKRTDIEALKAALGRCEIEYNARVGLLYLELDQITLTIEEYEHRIWWLQEHPETPLEHVERAVDAKFSERREEMRDEEETSRKYEAEFERQRPELGANEAGEAKRLYRELAKRFHPDLARTEEERERRATIMQQVNAAFQERDLEGLRHLAQSSEYEDPSFERKSIGEKLVWAIREVARLDGLIHALNVELITMKGSSIYTLWSRVEAGEPVIDELVAEIGRELENARHRLAVLVSTFRSLQGVVD